MFPIVLEFYAPCVYRILCGMCLAGICAGWEGAGERAQEGSGNEKDRGDGCGAVAKETGSKGRRVE